MTLALSTAALTLPLLFYFASSFILPPLNITDPTAAALPLLILLALVLLAALTRLRAELPTLGSCHPATYLFAYLFLSYVIRPSYDLFRYAVGSPQFSYFPLDSVSRPFFSSLILASLAITAFTLCFLRAPTSLPLPTQRLFSSQIARHPTSLLPFLILTYASIPPYLHHLATYRGRLFAGLIVRHYALAGANYLQLTLDAYKLAALLFLSARLSQALLYRKPFPVSLFILIWLPTIPPDIIGGERADFVLGNLFAFGILVAYYFKVKSTFLGRVPYSSRSPFRRPFLRLRAPLVMLGITAAATIFFVSYRVIVRENRGHVDSDAIMARLQQFPADLIANQETAGFDSFVFTLRAVPTSIPFRGFETLRSIYQAPLPARFFPFKTERSGLILTRQLAPSAYAHGANIAVSGLADLYFAGGETVLLIGMALLGALSGFLIRGAVLPLKYSPYSLPNLVLGTYAFVVFLPVLRSDLFALGILPVRLLEFMFIALLVTKRGRSLPKPVIRTTSLPYGSPFSFSRARAACPLPVFGRAWPLAPAASSRRSERLNAKQQRFRTNRRG